MRAFRVVSVVEGISLLLLLLVAMPLKYVWGMDGVVAIVGMAHGVLWLLYVAMSLPVSHLARWSVGYWLFALLMSVLPFGFLLLDRSLKRATRG